MAYMNDYFAAVAEDEDRFGLELEIVKSDSSSNIYSFAVSFDSAQTFDRGYFESEEIQSTRSTRAFFELSALAPEKIVAKNARFVDYSVVTLTHKLIARYSFETDITRGILEEAYSNLRLSPKILFDNFKQADMTFARMTKRVNKLVYPGTKVTTMGRKISFVC